MGKKIVCLVLVLISIGAFAEDIRVPVGAIIPLTGGAAEQGLWTQRGIDLAVREEAKTGITFSIAYDDSRGEPKGAIAAYTQMTMKEKPAAIVSWGSGVGVALTPLVNRDKILQIGVATASPKYRTVGDYTFRNFPSAELEAHFLADEVLVRRKVSEIATLTINNEYGLGSTEAFKARFQKGGGRVTFEQTVEPNETDFRPTLSRLKALAPKVVYLAVYPNEGAMLLKQARDLGLRTQFIASVAILGSKKFFELAGEGAEGMLVSATILRSTSADSPTERLIAAYRSAYGEELGPELTYVARAYDAIRVLGHAVRSCGGSEVECLREKLFRLRDFPGTGGPIAFDEAGDSATQFTLQRVEKGKFVEAR